VVFFKVSSHLSNQLKYIIGIDSGATSSEVVVFPVSENRKKGELKKYLPINLNLLGFDETARRLVKIINDCSKTFGLQYTPYIAAGISGARNEKDRRKLERYVTKSTGFRNIKVLPDTQIAFASVFEPGDKNCGIMIAGTGSILYFRNSKGELVRIGGWGRHIGDEGSGHWIAREALYKVTRSYDGREKQTALAQVLKKEFCIDSSNIIKEVYHNRFEISKITRHVFRTAEAGDKISIEILKSAAENLLSHFIPLKNRVCRIALMGSLFSEEKLLMKYFTQLARLKYRKIQLIKPVYKPVWGAVKIAAAMANIKK
jgi:N-acetylglucosamine kinase-like BadF-type ATPase